MEIHKLEYLLVRAEDTEQHQYGLHVRESEKFQQHRLIDRGYS